MPAVALPPLLTYPARPIQGGRLELAPAKRGPWAAEPKYNGWRALVHLPSRRMWNRHGQILSIGPSFAHALTLLQETFSLGPDWLDVEALDRRHRIARGSLVVLDAPGLTEGYARRREKLAALLPPPRLEALSESDWPAVFLTPSFLPGDCPHLDLYHHLHGLNHQHHADVFEGLVLKRTDTLYPRQTRNPSETFPFWMKHRFL